MKMKIVIIFFVSMLFLSGVFPALCSQLISEDAVNPEGSCYVRGTYMISTEWGQHGYYKVLCPWTNSSHTSRCRLGCWSVAIGQIINYHAMYYNLQSEGDVEYNCTNLTIDPWHIVSDLDETEYSWFEMSDKLNASSTVAQKENVSRLLYDTAIVIQKDFGTGGYLTVDNTTMIPNLINELIDHFPSINSWCEWDTNLTESEIVYELDHGRPIMFYTVGHNVITGETFPHAMVIDGYQYTGSPPDTFEVHLNYGWDGPTGLELPNTWYDYYGNFPTFDPEYIFDDPNYRKGLFIRMFPKVDYFDGPNCAHTGEECQYMVRVDFDTDPPLEFLIDWGDGTSTDWLGPYRLEETCTVSKEWRDSGVYDVTVKVKSVVGSESEWSDPYPVYVSRFSFLVPLMEFLLNMKDTLPGLEPFINILLRLCCL